MDHPGRFKPWFTVDPTPPPPPRIHHYCYLRVKASASPQLALYSTGYIDETMLRQRMPRPTPSLASPFKKAWQGQALMFMCGPPLMVNHSIPFHSPDGQSCSCP